jgi:hypothetical protein
MHASATLTALFERESAPVAQWTEHPPRTRDPDALCYEPETTSETRRIFRSPTTRSSPNRSRWPILLPMGDPAADGVRDFSGRAARPLLRELNDSGSARLSEG